MLTVNDSWSEIEQYVLGLEKRTDQEIWQVLHQSKISTYFIDRLIGKRWKVRCDYDKSSHFFGGIDKDLPIIHLANHLAPHQRDITLFHELAHLRHPILLSSLVDIRVTPFDKNEREIIVEYLGRKARANPELLRYAVLSFGLEPHIYDQASYAAFGVPEQLKFPFAADDPKEKLPLIMNFRI